MRARLVVLAAAVAATAAALPPSPASAREVQTTVTGWTKAPGPRAFDRLPVTRFGPAKAKTVLVLVPGTNGGRGDFTLTARDLVKRVRGLQVWAVDRRSQHLEDTTMFARALRGEVTTKAMFDYYAGWIADRSITDHYQPPHPSTLGYAADWGLRVQLEDVRRVVRAARRGGRKVILGGHSLGASVAVAYAAWDFRGRAGGAGYRDLAGLVLIDGGLRGSFRTTTQIGEVDRRLAEIRKQPFLDLLGLGLPWMTGVLAETGAILTLREPTAPSMAQAFPVLPSMFKPPMPATNRGQFGFAFDASTSPEALSLIHVRAGTLGPDGDWRDGEVTPIRRLAETFGQEPANAVEWFYPARLNLDVDAASPLRMTSAARHLGLRLGHARQIDLPVYALQTSLTKGAVLRGARRLIKDSRVPRGRSMLVDASKTDSHLDPLTAAPSRSRYLKTVVPFLKRLAR
jgi:pimeloyl-ACP methyl ester carboxylesterase